MKTNFLRSLFLLGLLILSAWAVSPFFKPGLPNTHDGQTHVMRLASFHQALIDGQFPPRWAGNLAYGFGSPVLSFSFQFPYFLGEIFHLFGLSFVDSTKTVFILSFVFSGLTMFLFLSRLANRLPAFLGTVLYLLAPYRFLDLYVRGDVGESLVFVFPPLILWLLWDQEKIDFKRISFATFAVGAMFLSHQIMAAVFLVIIFILLLSRRRILVFSISVVLGFLIAAFNLLPLIFEKRLTNLDYLVATNYQNQFPTIQSLLYSPWHWGPAAPENPEISMAFQLGIAQWLAVGILALLLIGRFKSSKDSAWFLGKTVLVLFALFLFLITSYSDFFWRNIFFLPLILYPWRLIGAEVFLVALIAALVVYLVKSASLKIFLSIILVVLALYGNRNHTQVVGRTVHDDSFYLSFPGTSDMWGEFLPKGTELPRKAPIGKVEVLEGGAIIENLKIKSNEIVFNTENHGMTYLRVNNFYYPGWQVWIDDQKIELKPSKLLEFSVPEGTHLVKARFTETLVRRISSILSVLTLILLLSVVAFKSLNHR